MMNLTSESVCPGHPDKLADQIADAIVDAALTQNPQARIACEVLVSFAQVCIAGEISGASLEYESIVRQVIRDVGYITWTPAFACHIQEQAVNIAQAITAGEAGDQGIVYGYATRETSEGIPLALFQAHQIARVISILGPDGKAQVTTGDMPNVFVSINDVEFSRIEQVILVNTLSKIVGHPHIKLSFFPIGGPAADTGVTGRKVQVDTYGGAASHGGGAFSGKDASKIDRSGAYLARAIALALLKHYDLLWVEIGIAYGFGIANPLWVNVRTNHFQFDFRPWVFKHFDFRLPAIIERFGLRAPIYRQTATFGHFGRKEFPWEK